MPKPSLLSGNLVVTLLKPALACMVLGFFFWIMIWSCLYGVSSETLAQEERQGFRVVSIDWFRIDVVGVSTQHKLSVHHPAASEVTGRKPESQPAVGDIWIVARSRGELRPVYRLHAAGEEK